MTSLKTCTGRETGALLAACVDVASILACADQETRTALSMYGQSVGLAFQIRDDILDVTASAKSLGKTPQKDQRDGKSTFVSLLGLDEAEKRLARTDRLARQALATLAQTI